jgi:hypothetical protein
MRGTRLFFGIFLAFLFLTGSAFAQVKVSADTTKGVTTTSKSEAAKAEPSSNAKAAPTETSAPAPASKTGVSVKASGAAQPAAEVKSSADVATPAQSAGEPAEGATGQTTTSAEADKVIDSSTYSVRLRDLEQRINELKEQVFRSKARLSLLAETILQGAVSGSQARLIHENRMGSSYLLVKTVYALDGAPIFNKTDEEGSLNDSESFDIYNGSMVPGEHTITANLEYRGRGFGIFSYLKGYRFKVKSSYTFNAPEGKAITVRVVSYEKGGPTAPLEDRPAIRYVERVTATSSVASAEKGGK